MFATVDTGEEPERRIYGIQSDRIDRDSGGVRAEDVSDTIHITRDGARREIANLLYDPANAGKVYYIEETFS